MTERKNIRQVFLDTETTGKKKEFDRIIEIALIEAIDGVRTGKVYRTLINPEGKSIDEKATEVHKLVAADLEDAPTFKEVAEDIVEFIRGAETLAFNHDFDAGFINMEMEKAGYTESYWEVVGNTVDVLAIARAVFPGQRNGLDVLLDRLKIDKSERDEKGHSALLDTSLMIEAYNELLKSYDISKPDLETDIPRDPVRFLNLGNYTPVSIELSPEDLAAHEKILDSIQKEEKVVPVERKVKEVSDSESAPSSPRRPTI